jgi:starch-binding outer membrane protein, SusD/RagB family
MHRIDSRRERRHHRRLPLALVAPAIGIAIAACDDITSLDQEAPSRVVADALYTPANAQLLVTSAIGDFECALANYIVAAGLVGDELLDAQLSQVGWDYDRRTIVPALTTYAGTACGGTQVPGLYTPLSVARFQADKIAQALQGWTDAQVTGRQGLIAQAAAFAGYSLVLLGEGMCSAAIDLGPELTRAQVNNEAEKRFDAAIAAATTANDAATLNMARVGRARAKLNQGKLNEARADAALVPDGFVKTATYSAVNFRRENLVNTQTYRGNFSSVEPSYRTVTWNNAPDPRVSVANANVVGQDRVTQIWRPAKYPTSSTPIPIASWREARLIEAEAAATAGDANTAVTAINKLHTAAGISAYAAGTAAQALDQVKEERRRELFLEGHRLADMIRFRVPLSPAAGTPFPTKGGLYGDQLCFPLPDLERNNNPNIPKS